MYLSCKGHASYNNIRGAGKKWVKFNVYILAQIFPSRRVRYFVEESVGSHLLLWPLLFPVFCVFPFDAVVLFVSHVSQYRVQVELFVCRFAVRTPVTVMALCEEVELEQAASVCFCGWWGRISLSFLRCLVCVSMIVRLCSRTRVGMCLAGLLPRIWRRSVTRRSLFASYIKRARELVGTRGWSIS